MVKTRLKVIVKETLKGQNESSENEELVKLGIQFEGFKVKIHKLVESLKHQHSCMIALNKARLNVAVNVAKLSEQSPLSDCAGTVPLEDEEPDESNLSTYMSVHANMHKRIDMYQVRFAKFVVDYAVEWERVVVGRVSSSLKKAKLMRRELDHYSAKVESIRLSTNKIMAKGKMVKPEQAEKLKRNEEKLVRAREHYQEFANDLCLLIEEVTERSWKDLHPIFIKLAQFDASVGADEDRYFSNLMTVANQLKHVAQDHGLKPQARLKDIQTQHGKLVSTKTIIHNESLALENGDAQDPVRARTGSDGGLFGTSSAGNSDASIRSFESSHSLERDSTSTLPSIPSTTAEMLVMASSAPPPPTFDQVEEANRQHEPSAPPAAAPPPPPPPSALSMFSINTIDRQSPPAIDTNPFYNTNVASTSSTPKSANTSNTNLSINTLSNTFTNSTVVSPSYTPRSNYNPFDSSESIPEQTDINPRPMPPKPASTNPFDN